MASSEMLRSVALVRINVSEEFSASIIRVTRIGELRTMSVVNYNRQTLMTEALSTSETSFVTTVTRRNIPETTFFIVTAVKTSNLKYY
jgi:hypothetical protein